jgi:hypothetical protein
VVALVRVPFPTLQGKKKKRLFSLNAIPNRFVVTKVKNQFKTSIMDWFLPSYNGEPMRSVLIEAKVLRHNQRKLDAINMALPVKWFEDCLIDLGYIKDDDKNMIILHPTVYESGLNETMIEITIKEKNG